MLFFAMMTAIFFVFIKDNGGKIEGQLFPVATLATIERFEVAGTNRVKIWGSFEILRPSCTFKGIEWTLEGVRRSTIVPIKLGPPKVREAGFNEFGPWEIELTREQVETQSSARVFHQCGPFYLTVTDFYIHD